HGRPVDPGHGEVLTGVARRHVVAFALHPLDRLEGEETEGAIGAAVMPHVVMAVTDDTEARHDTLADGELGDPSRGDADLMDVTHDRGRVGASYQAGPWISMTPSVGPGATRSRVMTRLKVKTLDSPLCSVRRGPRRPSSPSGRSSRAIRPGRRAGRSRRGRRRAATRWPYPCRGRPDPSRERPGGS